MRTFTVEALVDNKERLLKPGFFAKGVILTKLRRERAWRCRTPRCRCWRACRSVYVINNGTITQQSVTLGVRQGDLWEVTEGLKGDEVLATSRLNELATGVKVRILKPGETETAAGEGAGRPRNRSGRAGCGRPGPERPAPQGGGAR